MSTFYCANVLRNCGYRALFLTAGKTIAKGAQFQYSKHTLKIYLYCITVRSCKSPRDHFLNVRSQRHRLLGPTVNRHRIYQFGWSVILERLN